MRIQSSVILTVLAVSIMCIIVCSVEPPMAPMNYAEGNCVGMVRDKAGSRVVGASLMLFPEGYSPFLTTNGNTIDSTTSDEYGRYGFSVDVPGAYNLLAKGKGGYAMRRTIRISADARVILDDEILKEPGSMRGVVHLQSKEDHSGAIILLMGTNVYAKPFDSTGAFSIAALAQGLYTLRVLTAGNDYAAAETTITIASNMQTTVPCIELHTKFVLIDSLTVVYDTAMMRFTLTWPAVDTSRIKNYAVYCNRSGNLDPIAIVDKSATTYAFDIFDSPIDTFTYQISTVGNDGMEGPSVKGKTMVKSSVISLKKINYDVSFDEPSYSRRVFVDRQDHIFIVSATKIAKLDSNGTFIREFKVSSDTNSSGHFTISYSQIRTDADGNLYTLFSTPDSMSLIKLNGNLEIVRELPIAGFQKRLQYSIAVSAPGAVMVNGSSRNNSGVDTTFISIYDPQFRLIDTTSLNEKRDISQSVNCDDTILCLAGDGVPLVNFRIIYLDNSFKEISPPAQFEFQDTSDEFSSYIPPGYSLMKMKSSWFFLIAKDLLALHYCGSSSFLLFIDSHNQVIARIPVYNNQCDFFSRFFLGLKGYFYGLPSEENILLKYSIDQSLKSKWGSF